MSNRASNTNVAPRGQLAAVPWAESHAPCAVALRSTEGQAHVPRPLDVDVPPKIG